MALASLAPGAEPAAVVVIVHPSRTDAMTVQEVRRIYLRQRRFWDDREPIFPVNREYGSEIRTGFERVVFGAMAASLVRYWNEQYFQGVLPPPTLASDTAVRQYVAVRRNAIGYVDARQADSSVRVVLRLR